MDEYLQREVVPVDFASQSLITPLENTTQPKEFLKKSKLALWFFSAAQRDLEIQTKHFKPCMSILIFTNQEVILLFHYPDFTEVGQ